MSFHYTNEEKDSIRRAEAILAKPDSDFPDLGRAEYHKARARAKLKRIEADARKRTEEPKGTSVPRGQNSRRVDANESDRQRRERLRAEAFIEAIRNGTPLGEKYYANLPDRFLSPRTVRPAPVVVAVPLATSEPVRSLEPKPATLDTFGRPFEAAQ